MLLPILSMAKPASSNLSFSSRLVPDPTRLFLTSNFYHLSIAKPTKTTPIRMGGGPRTFPGGVSKWQWKRMQQKKAKQLLRARLARERQIYEMRKRAELSAAVSELERPWEVVEKAPKLFSTSADEQLKVLADRFQKPGGFDLWSEKDGPQLFETVDGVPSARFFPKGVVHSIKPYGRITDGYSDPESGLVEKSRKIKNNGDTGRIGIADTDVAYQVFDEKSDPESGFFENSMKIKNKGDRTRMGIADTGVANQVFDENSDPESGLVENSRKIRNNGDRRRMGIANTGLAYQVFDENPDPESGLIKNSRKIKNNGDRRRMGIANTGLAYQVFNENPDPESSFVTRNWHGENSRNTNGKFKKNDGFNHRESGSNQRRDTKRVNGGKEHSGLTSKVFDMSLQDDGSYGVSRKEMEMKKMRRRIERK